MYVIKLFALGLRKPTTASILSLKAFNFLPYKYAVFVKKISSASKDFLYTIQKNRV